MVSAGWEESDPSMIGRDNAGFAAKSAYQNDERRTPSLPSPFQGEGWGGG